MLVFDSMGTYLLSFGKPGSDAASFERPTGVAIGPDGSICVSDAGTNRILVFDPLPVTVAD